MTIGPFTTYSPPGIYVQTIAEPVLNQLLGGLRVPVLIGVGQNSLTQTNFELIRGSSSVADTPVYNEDTTGQYVLGGSATNPTLGNANGSANSFRVRNYPIVDGTGIGKVTYATTTVSVTVNGQQAVVSAVNGATGIVTLLIAPQSTDVVIVNYYFHRGDTRITDNVSGQVTTTPGVMVAPSAQPYNVIQGTNDTLVLTVDSTNIVSIKLTPGATRAAVDVANDINAAAATDLTASVHIDAQGLSHVQLVSQGNITIGSGNANGTLGFVQGQTTGRNLNFVVFNGPIVDGSGGGITTTDPSKVTVVVNGQQVLAAAVNGQSRTVTLPFAPYPGSIVTIAYWFNTWQDTFDYLPNSDVQSVNNVGIGPGRNDYLNGPDFIVINNGDQSIIQWGTAFNVVAGIQTGTAAFDDTIITGMLVDNRIFGVPLARYTNPSTASVSTTQFVLPLVATTGNGRDTPLGESLFQTVTNGRIDLPTNRPDLVLCYVGKTWRDAKVLPPVQVLSVDSSQNLVTLANPVPADYQVFATFWYNTITEDVFTFTVTTPGPSGIGQYTISSQATGGSVYGVSFGTVSGLSQQVQWPSGVQNVPDAFLTGAGTPVAETVTVTFNSAIDPATNASFTNGNQQPYDIYTYSQNFGGIVIDNNSPITVNLGTAYPALLVGQAVSTPLSFLSTDYLVLKIDGISLAPVSMSGLTTMAEVAIAINAVVDADTQTHADGTTTFASTAPNNLASATALGPYSVLEVKSRSTPSATNGLISSILVQSPVTAGYTDGSPKVGFGPNQSAAGSFNAIDQAAQMIGTLVGPFNISSGVNDNLQLTVDGYNFGVTLPGGSAVPLADVVTAVNDAYLAVASPADITAMTTSLVAVVNELKAVYNTHIASSTYHLNADTVNAVSAANAVDLPSAITLVNNILTEYNAHLTQASASVSIASLYPAANGFGVEVQTSAAHGLTSGQKVVIAGVVGTPVNGTWLVTVIDPTHFTLNNSVFLAQYTSGGTVTFQVHALADSANEETLSAATSLQTAVALAHSLQDLYNFHLLQEGVHGHDDLVDTETLSYQAGIGFVGGGIAGTANNGGLIEITTASGHGFQTGAAGVVVIISGVTGTIEANGRWTITVIDATHFTLNGSAFVNAWISGGAVWATSGIVNVSNSAGLIEITTATATTIATNDTVAIVGVNGVPAANGAFQVTVIDGTHFTLQGSTFAGAYTGGGIVQDVTTVQALLNSLKTQINLHFLASGVHLENDTFNTITTANATDPNAGPNFPLSSALANAIKTALNAHFIQSGVHVINDITNTVTTANSTATGLAGFQSVVTLTSALGHYYTAGAYNTHLTQVEGIFNVHGTNDLVDTSTTQLTSLVASEGAGVNTGLLVLTSRTNTVSSIIQVLPTSTASVNIGFVAGQTANRIQPTAAAIANALNVNTAFGTLGLAYALSVAGLGYYLEIDSRSVGSTSTIAFTNIANSALIPDTGIGIVPGVSVAVGANAQEGYVVTSSAGLAGSHGQGFPGQTYTDATTGLRFTVLSQPAGDYTNGGSFTLVVSPTFTCNASIPILAVPATNLFVYNTLNMNPGDTGIVSTYPHNGVAPAIGDFYYISYQYGKTDLSPQLYRDLKTIQINFGAPTPSFPLSLGASLALLNGAVIVGLSQVLPAAGQTQAPVSAYTAAIDVLRSVIAGSIKPDIITPLTTDPSVMSYLNQHCIFMSSPRQEGERMGVVGTAVGTTPLGCQAIAQGLSSELMVVVYPDSYVITITDSLGNSIQQLVDGSFCAAAVCGASCNPSLDVATPWTRRQVLGFTSLGRVLDPTDANATAVSGVSVIEQVPAGLRIRQGLTTNVSTVITRTPSVTLTIQYVQQTMRTVLDPYIGNKLTGATIQAIQNQITGMFGQLIDQQIVQSVSGISVATDPNDPTILTAEAVYVPVFPLEYIVATLQITVSS